MTDNNIQFQEDDFNSAMLQRQLQNKTPAMISMLIKWGIAKDTKQAQLYLLGLVVVIVALSVFVMLSALGGDAPVPVDINAPGMPGGPGGPGVPGNF